MTVMKNTLMHLTVQENYQATGLLKVYFNNIYFMQYNVSRNTRFY